MQRIINLTNIVDKILRRMKKGHNNVRENQQIFRQQKWLQKRTILHKKPNTEREMDGC